MDLSRGGCVAFRGGILDQLCAKRLVALISQGDKGGGIELSGGSD
jgi:hypothetical protein